LTTSTNRSAAAVVILRGQLGEKRKDEYRECVFVYHGKPVTQVNGKAWKNALKAAGIVDFRWHDLRHTWASWHVQAGTPLHVLQELGSGESVEMVRRYAHLSADHLASYMDRVSGLRAVPAGEVATLGLQSPEIKTAS
jgi:integrase